MLKKLTLKLRLIFVIGFLSVLLIAIGIVGLNGMRDVADRLESVYEDRLVPSHQLADIEYLMQRNIMELNLAGMHDPRLDEHVLHDHPIELHTDRVRENIERITHIWDDYMQTYLTEREARLAENFARLRGEFVREGLLPAIELYEVGEFMEANMHMIRTTNPAFHRAFEVASELMNLQEEVAAQEYAEALANYQATRNFAILAITLGVLIAIFVGWLLMRAIINPLKRTVSYFKEISSGNLNNQIRVDKEDEIGEVLLALQEMQNKLRGLVSEIKASVDAISTASSQIAAGNTDLSQRTEEQASSLEETASSMEELTSTVRQNADNARQANQLSFSASEVAEEGGARVQEAVEKMHELTASAEKMSEIISVIDTIAFQTNILALNAAVEAARAGEQGRGFAVVAGEVRSLAQRSATAAKEIQELIRKDGQIVDATSSVVQASGESMKEIVTSVKRVSDIMSEIAAASDEQSQGIEQVNQAVMQMDDVTQQNAALVEEAAAAAESLQDQAESLTGSVSIFRVDEEALNQLGKTQQPQANKTRQVANKQAPTRPQQAKPAGQQASKRKAPLPPPKRQSDDEWEEF
ncbi:methyl-accepting chemotaxis sensory transducer with TarH sensor [Marinospirillum celere]|uniref:Methyl-accepting chemotaxis sensory transducer with TarH sensor n=2 Tax=Marinospirillum celere TaxID=1122252 RepID=A0A1I1ECF0_9GAMM|nr:methyl-accepting chemotaxis sensory transducer with TarH sensor [Marinospirillum celere]